ncbi:hypothetical protein HDF16_005326 [Granulicella aggregans]|uniref:Uncharacterized protein n=1 Tax=Granulicella aggregans TaxID=474949 RepID=A0A7W8E7S8_9BACT|nr:hypothetical protein [Granulicella aggregans]MBB5060590.1 hypothetical protein [Granulicella aggregans]
MIASAEFLDQWTLEDMPACDEGMALLEVFARLHTEEWKGVLAKGLIDVRPEVIGLYSERWIAFVNHCNVCDDCNEL